MVTKKLLDLINLFRAKAFCIHKVAKAIVICKNENFMFTTFQVVLSYLKNLDDSQKFAVVGFVLGFC